jgi:UDP-N-acetylglucosamine:LPS N-acetylglucosamine transferase
VSVERSTWLVLPDPFPTRVFVDCSIVEKLGERLEGRLHVVLAVPRAEALEWESRLSGRSWQLGSDLFPADVGVLERAARRVDLALDRNVGYYPLSVRHSLRHGFNRERMRDRHPNLFLDSSLTGRLPESETFDRAVRAWLFSPHRYASKALVSRMRETASALVVANVQSLQAVPYLNAARRLGLPVVGYVASWDHTVGKGIVPPNVDRYVVQNGVMRDDLVRHHAISPARVVVTGWPQSDVFHRSRPRGEYATIVTELGLDPERPVILVAGNTPTNTPYEGRFVERLVAWSSAEPSAEQAQLLFRPHPRDREWRERFAPALATPGVAVQEPSYTDIEDLATLLQHVDVVVCNAGTILLDALANDRPCVCVLYDEGAPQGEQHAALNVTGRHYEELIASDAFTRATGFAEVVSGLERSLSHPEERAAERRRIAREVLGQVDGHSADRVVEAIVEIVSPDAPARRA